MNANQAETQTGTSTPSSSDPVSKASTLAVSVILPAYNEEAAICDDLDDVRVAMDGSGYEYEVIVVDDGSTDGTANAVRTRPWVRLMQHAYNRGTGAARTTGVRAARGRVVVFTDADRTYPNDRIPELLERMDAGADMVIGARRSEAGTVRVLRTPAKWFLRRLAEFMTGSRIPDLNSGLRAQRRDATLRFLPILPTSHSWVSTITIAFLSSGYFVEWTPIDYFTRVGRSTFHPLRDTYNYVSLIVRTVMYFNPLKIFLPLAIVLVLLGTSKYLFFDILWRFGAVWPIPAMPGTTLVLIFTGLQVAVVGLLADLIVRRTRL
jgi:glycosyltransferase involved in cell wall biosynthesis